MNKKTPVQRKKYLADAILSAAVEGGINYWASVFKWNQTGVSAVIVLNEDIDMPEPGYEKYATNREYKEGEKLTINQKSILRGLHIIASGKTSVAETYRKRCASLMFWPYLKPSHPDFDYPPDFDAYDADMIVQAGLFDNVIYG